MRTFLTGFVSVFLAAVVSAGVTYYLITKSQITFPQIMQAQPEVQRIFDPYTIENLQKAQIPKNNIAIGEILEETQDYTAYVFRHEFSPTPGNSELKHTTGRLTVPALEGKFPIILMLRGYVDQEIYETGTGSKNAANYFSTNGYITVAPDFLGYGGSSEESAEIFETRFQTYTTALSVLHSLETIKQWDGKNIFIWGHSNGGQIALTLLTITGGDYPTTLWAPVTKPFPYSVLYYTDESIDGGKYIRKKLAELEATNSVEDFSFVEYLEKIKAPIQMHQGTEDDAVPYYWTSQFAENLENIEVAVEYFEYPGADHNLRPSWDAVVLKDLEFFEKNLK